VAWMQFALDPVWGGRFEVLLEAAKRLRDDGHRSALRGEASVVRGPRTL
jgi:hypothetical protein